MLPALVLKKLLQSLLCIISKELPSRKLYLHYPNPTSLNDKKNSFFAISLHSQALKKDITKIQVSLNHLTSTSMQTSGKVREAVVQKENWIFQRNL